MTFHPSLLDRMPHLINDFIFQCIYILSAYYPHKCDVGCPRVDYMYTCMYHVCIYRAYVWVLTPKIDMATWPFLKFVRVTWG